MTEQSDSTETHSNSDEPAISHSTPVDQSEALLKGQGVAEAALQDGESVRVFYVGFCFFWLWNIKSRKERNRTFKPESSLIQNSSLFHFFTVETLRQLILQDFGEDCWSHDSDDTPTNEMAAESNSFTERQRPESLETVLSCCTDEWEAEPEELLLAKAPKPSVQVMRKGKHSLAAEHPFSHDFFQQPLTHDCTKFSDN